MTNQPNDTAASMAAKEYAKDCGLTIRSSQSDVVCEAFRKGWSARDAEVTALRAERDRLQTALERIAKLPIDIEIAIIIEEALADRGGG